MCDEESLKKAEELRRQWGEADAKRDAGNQIPPGLDIIRDVAYGPDGKYNLLDIYKPEGLDGRLPVIINVHGGGYFYGYKEVYQYYCMRFAVEGFAVVNINYHLSPEYCFPTPLNDIDRILAWVCENDEKYSFDTDNIFMMGDSAGAQLTSQYAAINTDENYRRLFGFERRKRIRAVSLACGMFDLKTILKDGINDDIMRAYLGEDMDVKDERLDIFSHITKNYPPAYVMSSKDDFFRMNAEPMAEYVMSRGGEAEAVIYGLDMDEKVEHVFHVDMRSDIAEAANKDQIEFFKKHIKN